MEKLGGEAMRDKKMPGNPVVRVDLIGPTVTGEASALYLAGDSAKSIPIDK